MMSNDDALRLMRSIRRMTPQQLHTLKTYVEHCLEERAAAERLLLCWHKKPALREKGG